MESLEEMISKELGEFADSFFEERGIKEDKNSFDLRILPLGELGSFRVIFYGDEVVGSMLHYKDELVTFGYMKRSDISAKRNAN